MNHKKTFLTLTKKVKGRGMWENGKMKTLISLKNYSNRKIQLVLIVVSLLVFTSIVLASCLEEWSCSMRPNQVDSFGIHDYTANTVVIHSTADCKIAEKTYCAVNEICKGFRTSTGTKTGCVAIPPVNTTVLPCVNQVFCSDENTMSERKTDCSVKFWSDNSGNRGEICKERIRLDGTRTANWVPNPNPPTCTNIGRVCLDLNFATFGGLMALT